MTGVVRIAFWLAVVLALLSLGSALVMPAAVAGVFLFGGAAIGLRRRRAWGGYGIALYCAVQIALGFLLFNPDNRGPAISLILWGIALGFVFFRAGKAISDSGGKPGLAWPWLLTSILSIGFVLSYRAYIIPTGSMENTLSAGDGIVAQIRAIGPISRDEVLIFRYPPDPSQTQCKRVAGLPGDRLHMSNKRLMVNGIEVDEPWAIHKIAYLDSYRDNFPSTPNVIVQPRALDMLEHNVVNGELVVPPGSYFVLGDNRDQSFDSRYFGLISRKDIIGKALFIYDSREHQPGEAANRIQYSAPIRWDRTFRMVH